MATLQTLIAAVTNPFSKTGDPETAFIAAELVVNALPNSVAKELLALPEMAPYVEEMEGETDTPKEALINYLYDVVTGTKGGF